MRACGVELSLVEHHVADFIQRRCNLRMDRPVHPGEPGQRLLEERLRFARETQAPVDLSDRALERSARIRLRGKLRVDPLRPVIQQLARSHLIAASPVGIGELEQVDEKPRNLLGAHPAHARCAQPESTSRS